MDILSAIEARQTALQHTETTLIENYGDSVYRFCRSLTYSKEDAEDLFQETFLSVFVNLAKLNASNAPQSFLFSTALYIWKSWKRKYARRMRLAPVELLDETIAEDISLEDSFIQRDELRTVREMVKSLPDKFKIPIILYYAVGQNIKDIAVILKLPAGTVKSRLFNGRKLIEKGLANHEK